MSSVIKSNDFGDEPMIRLAYPAPAQTLLPSDVEFFRQHPGRRCFIRGPVEGEWDDELTMVPQPWHCATIAERNPERRWVVWLEGRLNRSERAVRQLIRVASIPLSAWRWEGWHA